MDKLNNLDVLKAMGETGLRNLGKCVLIADAAGYHKLALSAADDIARLERHLKDTEQFILRDKAILEKALEIINAEQKKENESTT